MEIENTFIPGMRLIHLERVIDDRGTFQKIFHFDFFQRHSLNSNFKESYCTISHKNVIRGMHFQSPPYDHTKLVYLTNGMILDVVLDIRKSSPSFKQFFSIELRSVNPCVLYIPPGCAHGFKSLTENAIVTYFQTSVYNKDCDTGILWNSFGMQWGEEPFIISDRDLLFQELSSFESPFK